MESLAQLWKLVMGWDPNFIVDLGDSSVEPKFLLQFLDMPDFIGDQLVLSGGYNQIGLPSIAKEGPSFRGVSVIPQTWNVSFGSFSVPLCGDITNLFPTIRKGSIAELFVDLNGVVERVAIGQLRNIRGFGSNWRLDFVDLLSAMTARASGEKGTTTVGNDPDKFSMFPLVGKEQEITANWFASGSSFPTTISVDDVRPFQDIENGGYRVAKITSASNVVFYVQYDSTTITSSPAGTLNLSFVHSTTMIVYPSTNACVNAATGSKITSVGLLNGVPYKIFAKILLSRDGNLTNVYDKYKKNHNFGAFLDTSIFDSGDAGNQSYLQSSSPSTVPYEWSYAFFAPFSNGIRQFVSTAALTGQWPTWRQNSLSWRGCQDPDQAQSISGYITDRHIISIDNIDIFDPNSKQTFYRSRSIYGLQVGATELTYHRSQTFGEAEFLPAESVNIRDTKYIYAQDPNTAAPNRRSIAGADTNRLFQWDTRLWSKIQLRVKMNYAKLTAGDIIEIKSDYIRTFRNSTVTDVTYRAMVLSVSWSFLSSSCTLEIAILLA